MKYKLKEFNNNEIITFLGDSITHNGKFIKLIDNFYKNNFPEKKLTFYNCGIAGGTIQTGLDFYDEDLMVTNPSTVIVMYGMNDCNRLSLNEKDKKIKKERLSKAFKLYKTNYSKLYELLNRNCKRVILMTPTPYDEFNKSSEPFLKGCYKILKKYSNYVKKFAKEKNIEIIDLNSFVGRKIKKNEGLIETDHVHPTSKGHFLIAKYFLNLLNYNLIDDEINEKFYEQNKLIDVYRNMMASKFLFPCKNDGEELVISAKQTLKRSDDDINLPYFKELANVVLEYNGDLKGTFEKIKAFNQKYIQ